MSDRVFTAQEKEKDTETSLVALCRQLVPWLASDSEDILKMQTEQNPKHYLDSFYLFPVDEICVNSDCDDIPQFINERFQNVLAAASHSGLSVALILSFKSGKSSVFLGFKSESDTESNLELFESIVNGLLPGKEIKYEGNINISSLADGFGYGGMVTGVPILRSNDEKQKFRLSSVARGLYGKDYLLAVISKPLNEKNKLDSLDELIKIRDNLHAQVHQTLSEEKGSGKSVSESGTKTIGTSKTKGNSFGIGIGIGGFLAGYSHSWSKTETESMSKTETTGLSKNQSRSLSIEKQNGCAMELEKLANQYIERMIQGLRSGCWETSITFAAQDETASGILSGVFAGELSRPSDKLLPPPRIYLDSLKGKTLFIPKISSSNILVPKSLASYITSEELSLISSPPTESMPGYEIQRIPALSLTDIGSKSEMILGSITDHGNPIDDANLYLSKNDLNKHLFVCGLTGSGKTTTVKHILKSLSVEETIPFLVLELAKRDYRQLLGDDVFNENLNIFTIGDATVSPIRFNPFYIQEGVQPLEHIDYLKAIFNASFSLYGPMPGIVEKCLHNIYIKKGWDLTLGTHFNFVDNDGGNDKSRYQHEEHYYCFPTLTDLKDEIDRYIKMELDYQGEFRDNIRTAIIVRLEGLCVGSKGLMFNTHDFFCIEELLSKNTLFEMESLADDDDKAFFVGLILVLISEYRQKENPAVNPGMGDKGMRHFMIIEEAHRLLKNVETERSNEMMGNPKGKAVEVFCNILAEMRSLGQGVAVVEQIPSKISPDVIKNSNTKIVHRLVSKDDQSLLAGSLCIDDNDALYLNRLKTGHALCHKEGMGRPVECKVLNDVDSHAIEDGKVKNKMKPLKQKTLHSYRAYQAYEWLGKDDKELCMRFFNSLVILQEDDLAELIATANDELKKLLIQKNVAWRFDKEFFSDYFTLRTMVLVNEYPYSQRNPLPSEFKSRFLDTMNKPTSEHKALLLDSLNDLWKPIPAEQYIKDTIQNQTILYLNLKNSSDFTRGKIESIASSFLLSMNKDVVQGVTQEILN